MKKTALILVCLALALSASAAPKVPISFDDFHGYTGTVAYLKQVAAAFPRLTELLEIGRSTLGRPIYVLVISNLDTGTTIDRQVEIRRPRALEVQTPPPAKAYLGKPGQWIDGGTHGNEYTGTEVCLYIIDKLLSGYGAAPEITALLDSRTIYVCPIVNPDGVFASVEREISQRGNGDSSRGPNAPRDLNGDGHITQFRFKDAKGLFVPDDLDARLMVRVAATESTAKPRYTIVTEGTKPFAGPRSADESGSAGIDVNRNFPEGWWTDDGLPGGTGAYPTSSPEARALVEFAVNHRNILMVQNFHTSGGFTYRVPGTSSDATMAPKDVAVYDYVLGKKYLEILGEPLPEAWANPDKLAEIKARMRGSVRNKYALERGYEMPRTWFMGYNEERDQRYGFGMVIDWWYQQYGAFATCTELWNPAKDIPDFEKVVGPAPTAGAAADPAARAWQERALLKYQDAKSGGKLFVAWKPYKHPELGDGEIGGWIPKYRGNALPGAPLLDVCEKHWKFELFRAGLLPQIVISQAQAKVLASSDKGKTKVVEVTAVIENTGPLATQVARGAQLNGNREDVVWLIGNRDKVKILQGGAWQRLGVLDGTLKLPGFAAAPAGPRGGTAPQMIPAGPAMPGQRGRGGTQTQEPIQTGPRREVRWLISVEGDTPIKVVVSSEKGGTAVKELTVR
ncbi:MAG: M14 family zinc carboxypeptidase [Candidatus Aminicenantes bacterium]|nr:M14 family zinc carboxypeptidase [Candidatus Aminicenantes bacterium]